MKLYSHIAVTCIIINYAVGTGILNLPHTLAAASIGVSLIMILIISFVSFLVGQFSLDVLSRSFALQRKGKLVEMHENKHNTEEYEQLTNDKADFTVPHDYTYQISNLCYMYFGPLGFYLYQITVVVYLFGTLWGYVSVVSSSLTSVIPLYFLQSEKAKWICTDPCQNYDSSCSYSYWIWTSIIMVYSTILIFFNISEQKVLQTIFTCFRFLLLLITCILTIYCLSTQPFLSQSSYSGNNFINPNTQYWDFNLQHIGSLFASVTFSQEYHHSLPVIFQPTDKKYQKFLNYSVAAAECFLFIVTLFVCLPGALYFGNNGTNLVTLNFTNWIGNGFSTDIQQPVFEAIISYSIRLIPPIYVLSAIPLKGLTMSLNVKQLFPIRLRDNKLLTIFINLFCIIPPILFGGFFRCLGQIIDFTGLTGYLILVAPCLCLIKAQKQCVREFGIQLGSYSMKISKAWVIYSVVVFNMVGFVLTLYSLTMQALK